MRGIFGGGSEGEQNNTHMTTIQPLAFADLWIAYLGTIATLMENIYRFRSDTPVLLSCISRYIRSEPET